MTTGVGVVTALATIVGIGSQVVGQQQQRRAQRSQEAALARQTQASIRAERARKRAAELEAQRKRREIVRNLIRTRAINLSRGVAAGTSLTSSGVQGSLAQTTGTAAGQTLAVNQNAELTDDIFAANEAFAQAGGDVNQARADIRSGQQVQQAGQNIIRNLPTISRVGDYATGKLFGS